MRTPPGIHRRRSRNWRARKLHQGFATRPPRQPGGAIERRLRHVQSEADRDPLRRRPTPARLDEHSRELAATDVQIVRPLHADRRTGQRVECFGGVQPTAEREHLERERLVGVFDEGEPDPCSALGRPGAPQSPAPRRLLVGEYEGAGRRRGADRIRDVERRRRGGEQLDARHVEQRRQLGGAEAIVSSRARVSGGRQGRTRPRARCGTIRRRRSRAS